MAVRVVEMAPGDELVVSGEVRIRFRQKSGRRAEMATEAGEGAVVTHVKAAQTPADEAERNVANPAGIG